MSDIRDEFGPVRLHIGAIGQCKRSKSKWAHFKQKANKKDSVLSTVTLNISDFQLYPDVWFKTILIGRTSVLWLHSSFLSLPTYSFAS